MGNDIKIKWKESNKVCLEVRTRKLRAALGEELSFRIQTMVEQLPIIGHMQTNCTSQVSIKGHFDELAFIAKRSDQAINHSRH